MFSLSFPCPSYSDNLLRLSSCHRFLKMAVATSNFMNESYNGEFAPGFSVSMLTVTIALVWDYVSETRK